MRKQQRTQKDLYLTKKQAHENNIIGVKKHNESTFLTSSEDATIRLWDIRTKSSVKIIKNKCLTNQISNPASDSINNVFIGSGPFLYSFDLRQHQIFIEQMSQKSEQPHLDDINRIKYCQSYKNIGCCDDQGDIRIYNAQSLGCLSMLDQEHSNILNDVEFIQTEHKDFADKKVCVSGGFDCTLVLWDVEEQKPLRKIPIADILEKYEIKTENPPFIHKICSHQSSIVLALQTGHIMCLPIYEPKKPKFIMNASLSRLTSCSLTSFEVNKNKKFLITSDDLKTFSMFDFQQRINKQPKFLVKYKTESEPIQIQSIANSLLVACESPTLFFYSLKD